MSKTGNIPLSAAVFGASGGIGRALVAALHNRGYERIYAGSRRAGNRTSTVPTHDFHFDLLDDASIAGAAEIMREKPPQLVIVATGVLTLESGYRLERSYKKLDEVAMAEMLALNTIGPALIAKHVLPLFSRDQRCVFAAISARVGSINDNRLGGWYSYRASKAALNMLLKNFAIDLGRTHPKAAVLGLHPGTVDTRLSQPFQAGLPNGQVISPQQSAQALLDVIEGAGPQQSGRVFDWKGKEVPA